MRQITPITIIDRIFGQGQDRRGVDVTGTMRTASVLLRLVGKRWECQLPSYHGASLSYHGAPLCGAPHDCASHHHVSIGVRMIEAAAAWFSGWAGDTSVFASYRPVLVEVVSVRR